VIGGRVYDRWLHRAIVLAWAGAAAAGAVALHEWSERGTYASGSTALALGFAAVAVVGAAAALLGHALDRHLDLNDRDIALDLRERADLRAVLEDRRHELENLRIAMTTNDEIREVYEFLVEPERDST